LFIKIKKQCKLKSLFLEFVTVKSAKNLQNILNIFCIYSVRNVEQKYNNMRIGKCLKCKTMGFLTRHHELPRTHYGNTKEIIYLCQSCHNDIEKMIVEKEGFNKNNRRRRLNSKEDYKNITNIFLNQKK